MTEKDKRLKRSKSIGLQLIGYLAGVFGIALLILAVYADHSVKREFISRLEMQLNNWVEMLEVNIVTDMKQGNMAKVGETISNIAGIDTVITVFIADQEGRPKLRAGGENAAVSVPEDVIKEAERTGGIVSRININKDTGVYTAEVYHPVKSEASCLRCHHDAGKYRGFMAMHIDASGMRKDIKKARLHLMLSGLALLSLMAGIILWLANRLITRPLLRIRDFAAKIASGDYTTRDRIEITNEIGDLSESLDQMADAIQTNSGTQETLNTLLRLTLKDISLEQILDASLETLFRVPWLSVQSKGAIFLTGDDGKTLKMTAQRGLAGPIRTACAEVPFGHCLCGKSAASGEIVYSTRLDHDHETTYEGIKEHGHYIIPILSGGKTIGILCLYLEADLPRKNKNEIVFLESVANLLAGIIIRRKSELELKRSQDRLTQSEKMSAVGQLAAGVAHEINNPLGIILGFAQSLAGRIKADDPMCLPLRSIEREAVRCKNLVQDLLVFSRTSKIDEEPVDLNEALTGALSMISARARTKDVEIVSELSPDLPRLTANKNKIQQVFINLANNAIDAMPNGGTLTIGASLSEGRPGYMELSVRDTGHGIAKEIRARVMEPFFTTKEPGQGTGLGLALVYEIVKKHNGSVELESEEGKGTCFRIFLPLRGALPPAVRP